MNYLWPQCQSGHRLISWPKLPGQDGRCPLCEIVKSHDEKFAVLQARNEEQEGTIDQLRQRIEDYRRELGL